MGAKAEDPEQGGGQAMKCMMKAVSFSFLMFFAFEPMVCPAHAKVVLDIRGFAATYPAGLIGGSSATGIPTNYYSIPPANEYYLDYRVMFETGWQCVKGGKLPGLIGGSHTTGCDAITADGWSARFMWLINCAGTIYLYDQNRQNNCGDDYIFSNGADIAVNQWSRITERVVINTPGQKNGIVQAWFNGKQVVSLTAVELRGSVSATTAMVDGVSLQTFYGGSTSDWAPGVTTHSLFSVFHVRDDLPDFTLPFDTVFSATPVQPSSAHALAPAQGPAAARSIVFSCSRTGLASVNATLPSTGRIGIYTVEGRLLRSLDLRGRPGLAWDGLDSKGKSVRPGVLLIRIGAAAQQ
jgi:hypothetical protein